jgi:PAS domain S-box-containing protein
VPEIVLYYAMENLSFLRKESLINPIGDYTDVFLEAIEKAMDGIALLDSEGKFYYLNDSYVKILGYQDQQELIGKSWRILYEELENNRIENEILPILLRDRCWRGYTHGIKKDKTPVLKELSLTLLEENGFICICREMDFYRKKEVALQRLAIVAEKTSSLVLISDPEGKIVWSNNSFRSKLGYSLSEVDQLFLIDFLRAKNISKRSFKLIRDSLKKSGVFIGEIEFIKKDNTKVYLYVDFTAIYDKDGNLAHFLSVNHDITPIKKAEDQLKNSLLLERQLNLFKTQFVNLVSHQFRTPLATIRTALDVLDINYQPDNYQSFSDIFQKYKTVIEKETLRMVKLLENILELGRIEENKIELYKKKIYFKTFMDRFINNFNQTYEDKRQLKYSFRGPDLSIYLDEIIFTNILENIVSNAFKYSQGRPEPELDITYQDTFYIISLKDYGIGIPENDKKFLFQSFFRSQNAKNIPGSGLGLLIAKRLVELQGGNIKIESSLDSGTTVIINLHADTLPS